MSRLLRWPGGFALTEAVEGPIYALALGHLSPGKRLWVALGASAITHPVVWFVGPWLVPEPYALRVVTTEGFAIGVEAWWLHRFGARDALWWAIFANSMSMVVGHLLHLTIGFP